MRIKTSWGKSLSLKSALLVRDDYGNLCHISDLVRYRGKRMAKTVMVKDHNGKLIPRDKSVKIRGKIYMRSSINTCQITGLKLDKPNELSVHPDLFKFYNEEGRLIYCSRFYNPDGSWEPATSETNKSNTVERVIIRVKPGRLRFDGKFNGFIYDYADISDKGWKFNWSKIKRGPYRGVLATPDICRKMEAMYEAEDYYDMANINYTGGYGFKDNVTKSRSETESYRGGEVRCNYQKNHMSDKYKKTGGMDYTFGVEIETAAGGMNEKVCESLGLARVGDGSIPADEYVTGVLKGDDGMKALKDTMDAIRERCFVDDLCSIHVHVGTHEKLTTAINYYLIKLGCMIEEELFQINSPVRLPYEKYCSSISKIGLDTSGNSWSKDFNWIENNRDSIKSAVAEYVWSRRSLDNNRNSSSCVPRWNKGRYKWLNLTHLNTGGDTRGRNFDTIELRIWSPTTQFHRVRCMVLLSMAFVDMCINNQYVIDNHVERGTKVTLSEMVDLTIKDQVNRDYCHNFIESRKEAYGRDDVYAPYEWKV